MKKEPRLKDDVYCLSPSRQLVLVVGPSKYKPNHSIFVPVLAGEEVSINLPFGG